MTYNAQVEICIRFIEINVTVMIHRLQPCPELKLHTRVNSNQIVSWKRATEHLSTITSISWALQRFTDRKSLSKTCRLFSVYHVVYMWESTLTENRPMWYFEGETCSEPPTSKCSVSAGMCSPLASQRREKLHPCSVCKSSVICVIARRTRIS
jgi:hypothetical protein